MQSNILIRSFSFLVLSLFIAPLHARDPALQWDWETIDIHNLSFPKTFLWGTATSAYQSEGNSSNSSWNAWGKKINKEAGNASDHWSRYKGDIELMKQLGLKAFRFSVAWSKIEPREGEFDEKALDHYAAVCKELKQTGIAPVITLHHNTHPQWFEEKGAFEKEENTELFVRFCKKVFEKLSDNVDMWFTFNAPTIYALQAYFSGDFPPGIKDNYKLMGTVIKNMLEAHITVYQELKKLKGGDKSRIGIITSIYPLDPWRNWHPGDKTVCTTANKLFNKCFLDFFTTGKFSFYAPLTVNIQHSNPQAPQSLDMLGINYYSHTYMKGRQRVHLPEEITTDVGRNVIYAEGLYRAIKTASQVKVPLYITENGIADKTDEKRQLFLQRHLYALNKAQEEGYDVRGYFYWSLLDNFEWNEGYDAKFGLYEVDFETQKRTMRASARWFKQVIAGEDLSQPDQPPNQFGPSSSQALNSWLWSILHNVWLYLANITHALL